MQKRRYKNRKFILKNKIILGIFPLPSNVLVDCKDY